VCQCCDVCVCVICVCVRYLFLGDDGNRMWCLCRAFVCVKMPMCVLCRSVWGCIFLWLCVFLYELLYMCADACVSIGLD